MSKADLPDVPHLEPGIYEHYKGNKYEVMGVGLHSESLEPLVIYKPLYETTTEYFMRPFDMFTETVVVDDQEIPRFKKVG